jgi:hypothetical protein
MTVEPSQSHHVIAVIAGAQMDKVLLDRLQISVLDYFQSTPPEKESLIERMVDYQVINQ